MIDIKQALNSITGFVANKNNLLKQGLIPVAASSRHIHISRNDLDILFGKGYQLKPFKLLSQPNQYAAEEKVSVIGKKGIIENVRILGPVRPKTQVEISITDGFKLGIRPEIRDSGNISGTPGVTIRGPRGEVKLSCGLIASLRHIHMTPSDADFFGVKDKDIVKVKTFGQRSLIFDKVLVRVNKNYFLEMHIDTDEANAAGAGLNTSAQIIK